MTLPRCGGPSPVAILLESRKVVWSSDQTLPARTNNVSQSKAEDSGELADIADCGRSHKWAYGRGARF